LEMFYRLLLSPTVRTMTFRKEPPHTWNRYQSEKVSPDRPILSYYLILMI
jgi:hypothetical protein